MGLKNAGTVAGAITTLASGEPLNDKELLLENGVAMLQSLPLNSGLSATISGQFIGMLWNDLPHPPPTIAGPTSRYRRHDGGYVTALPSKHFRCELLHMRCSRCLDA